jgi:hypothetical protein
MIGGTPDDKCKSEALFLTANASNCAISTAAMALLSNGLAKPGPEARGYISD